MAKKVSRTTIGRAERIDFPQFGITGVPAKIDTGADSSSLWVSNLRKTANGLQFCLFGPGSPYYTGQKIVVSPAKYSMTRVANSFGQKQWRYKVKMLIVVKGRQIMATVTLADRSAKLYPMLLGRRVLYNKFIVDVTKGSPLRSEERRKRRKLQLEVEQLSVKLGR